MATYPEVPDRASHEAALLRLDALEAEQATQRTDIDNLDARVTALENDEPEPDPEPTPTHTTLVGATTGYDAGYTWPQIIDNFVNYSQRPLDVRRCFDGGVPSHFDNSQLRHDNGVRAQVYSFKPSSTTSVQQVVDLLSSVPDKSRVYITPYHEPRDNMSANDFLARYATVRQAYDQVGGFAGMGPIFTNWGLYASNELDYVPGDGVDFIGIDPYGDPGYEDNLNEPITQSASVAIDLCNTRGIPLNIGEFGIDTSRASNSLQKSWYDSFQQLGDVVQVDWICYWHDIVGDFDCRLNSTSLPWYQALHDHYNA